MGNNKGNPFKRGKTWTIIYYVLDENGKESRYGKEAMPQNKKRRRLLRSIRQRLLLE